MAATNEFRMSAARYEELKKELEDVGRTREVQRKKRQQSRIPQVALVGYTNAGKSTILNRMVEQGALTLK